MISDRDTEGERVVHYGLDLQVTTAEAEALLVPAGGELSYAALDVDALEHARPQVVDAVTCTLTHASGRTLVGWLEEIGFQQVLPSYSGAWYARRLYDVLGPERRPRDLQALDAYLSPLIAAFVRFAAPIDAEPMITAVK